METESHKFKRLGISEHLLKSIEEQKFEEPTEIQEKSIPLVLQGKDVIATAATGSGKTLVFSSVIVQNTIKNCGIQAFILTPTRELAEQVTRTINKFAKHKELGVISVYGGVSINEQVRSLKYAEVVVGTPGRILDHIKRQTINLSKLKILVLDEADRMLDMGFQKDVEKIINNCPRKRQTLLFSATMSEEIISLTRRYTNDSIEISAEQYVDPAKLTQVYYDVNDKLKFSLLKQLIEKEESKLVMVFCNTRRNVDFVAKNLRFNNIEVLPIHGGFSQNKRNQMMEKFRSQKVQILVCTDVAARGLDIEGVTHIYNYDAPTGSKEYLHRIGRTARAGKEGKVINLISSRDYENFNNILRHRDLKISKEQTLKIMPVRVRSFEEKNRGRSKFRRNNPQRSFGRKREDEGSFDRPFRRNRRYKKNNNSHGRFSGYIRNNRFSRNSRR